MMYFSTLLISALASAVIATPLIHREAPWVTSIGKTDIKQMADTPSSSSYGSSSPSPTPSQSASVVSAVQLAGNPGATPNPVADPGFVGTLLSADSAVARFKSLQQGIANGKAALKFDFNPAANPGVKAGKGGEVLLANRVNFPMVTNLGIAGAALFFAPCGLNTPHTHPRGSEFLTVATDSNILTGFVLENGLVAEQNTTLTQYQGTVFPIGSVHWQQNIDCEPAVALAALSSDDPGASSIAQNFFINTGGDIVQAALGFPEQITADNFAALKSKIPTPFVAGIESCFQKCGLTY